ncbi:MAG: hypothetical protein MI757_17020 [Pirellulales bacterium]|nr:hypothetical protein [Pirellulales bacterium]
MDAVWGGCWERSTLIEAGKFDEEMVRNQDDELSFRLRKAGGRILQDASVRVSYHVRNSFGKLALQFAQYGYWKVRVIRKHPRQASVRHFVPSAFITTLTTLAIGALFWKPAGLGAVALAVAYLGAVAAASLWQSLKSGLALWPGITFAVICMHMGYGAGFLIGWLRRLFGKLPTDRVFEAGTR